MIDMGKVRSAINRSDIFANQSSGPMHLIGPVQQSSTINWAGLKVLNLRTDQSNGAVPAKNKQGTCLAVLL